MSALSRVSTDEDNNTLLAPFEIGELKEATLNLGFYQHFKTEQLSILYLVTEDEASGLLLALQWVQDLSLENVDFELSSKVIMDKRHANKVDEYELGVILFDYRVLLSSIFKNPTIEFVRRQTNEITHALIRVVISLVSL